MLYLFTNDFDIFLNINSYVAHDIIRLQMVTAISNYPTDERYFVKKLVSIFVSRMVLVYSNLLDQDYCVFNSYYFISIQFKTRNVIHIFCLFISSSLFIPKHICFTWFSWFFPTMMTSKLPAFDDCQNHVFH